MPAGPYRPDPAPPDAELARLTADGERRILDAHADRAAGQRGADERNRERNLRVALGGHYGSPLRKASVTLIVAGAIMVIGELVWDIDRFALGNIILVGAFLLLVFGPPNATRARVEAERAWASSLPFAMVGYFELLGAKPQMACVVTVTLAWSDPRLAAREEALRGLVGLVDTDARAESRDAGTAVIRSGRIVDRTRIRVRVGLNRTYNVHRNTRLVGYVHHLVAQVLLPLHRSHPIARVSLSRE